MSLLLQIIVTYIKENIITKLRKLYSPPRNSRAGNKSPMLFVKKPLCTGDLSSTQKIFIERPALLFLGNQFFLPEKLKTLIHSNYHRVEYFLLKLGTRFPLTNVYKRVFGIFLILFRS